MDLEHINLKGICQSKEQIIHIIKYHPTAVWVGRVMWPVLTNLFPMDTFQCQYYHQYNSQNGKDEHTPQAPHKNLAALPQSHAGIATTAATVKLNVSLFILSWSLFPYSTHGLVHGMKEETTNPGSSSLNWAKVYSQNNFYFFLLSRKCYLVTIRFLLLLYTIGFCLPRPCPSCTGDSIINYSMKKLPKLVKGTIKSNSSYSELIPLLL